MANDRFYFARRPFGYKGQSFDREQQIQLVGLVNDEKLERLGYVAPWPDDAKPLGCRKCAAKFLTDAARQRHGLLRHEKPAEMLPKPDSRYPQETEQEYQERLHQFGQALAASEDQKLEREERELNQVAPLFLDKTTAART